MQQPTSDLPTTALAQRTAAEGAPRYRILMIAPTSFFADYGCHVRILEETRILQKLGHQVTIVTYRNGNPVAGLDIRRTLPIPWRTHYEVGSSRHKLAFDALLGLKSWEVLARGRFDLIHTHLHEGALIGQILSRLFRIPLVFDFQGSLTEEMIDHGFLRRNGPIHGALRRVERWINHSSPVIFTSTAHAQRLLVDEFDCAPAQVVALPDCVDTETFQPATAFDPAALAALRAQVGIPAESKVIVYLGLLAEYQGTGLLLEAFQRILRERSNVYLLLMGFPGVEKYRQRAQALGIADRVILTGRIPYAQAPLHLALGDVGVAPKLSLTEGSGKLLNYMAAALPTVAFDTPVAREYLGVHGFYALRGDVPSLADKLLAALAAADLGAALRQRAIHHFDWVRAGQQITSIYHQLIDGQQVNKVRQTWLVGKE